MSTAKRKRLPKQVYVVWEQQPRDDESYMMVAETIEENASKDKKTVVGTYRLVREDVVTLVTKISQRKVRT